MSKLTRKQKKEEEQRIINEMREALREAEGAEKAEEETPAEPTEEPTKKAGKARFEDPTPEKIHCKRCKTLMEKGVCPTCGFRIYVPTMDETKKGKIKFALTCVLMALFVLVFVIIQIAKS